MHRTVPPRVLALDVARGLAILGTLATNIWIVSHQGGFLGYLIDPLAGTPGEAARAAQAFLMALSNGKFLGLLMILFGVGLAVQHASALRRGLPWPRSYWPRAGVLLLDGLVNYLLVIEFDVLMGYAVTGVVVAWLVTTTERAQRAVAFGCALLHVLVIGALAAVLAVVPAPEPDAAAAQALARPNPYADGTWGEVVLLRLDAAVLFRAEPVPAGTRPRAVLAGPAAGRGRADGAELLPAPEPARHGAVLRVGRGSGHGRRGAPVRSHGARLPRRVRGGDRPRPPVVAPVRPRPARTALGVGHRPGAAAAGGVGRDRLIAGPARR